MNMKLQNVFVNLIICTIPHDLHGNTMLILKEIILKTISRPRMYQGQVVNKAKAL